MCEKAQSSLYPAWCPLHGRARMDAIWDLRETSLFGSLVEATLLGTSGCMAGKGCPRMSRFSVLLLSVCTASEIIYRMCLTSW